MSDSRATTSTAGTPDPDRMMAHRRCRVLLADDDHDLRDALSAVLRQHGYVVDTVGSGIGLLDRLAAALLDGAKLPVDIIVTDVRMPGCNGLNIAEGLRDNGWAIPIVVISAFGDDEMRARVARLDNVTLLEKPFGDDELDRVLRGALAS